jgi:BirA family biotin operon repressor/biotin-[acetyl-CoA-carboxylase] ligase
MKPFLDIDAIRASTFVRHVEIHETLGSTNDRAKELAREPNVELPALVVARIQTSGRGRGNNKWWSADGALTFSILLDPAAYGIAPADWPHLSLLTAAAVRDALAAEINPQSTIRNPQSPCLRIKAPNDVLLDGRKVSGILIESPGGLAPAKDHLIIGIGINVNNSWKTAPPHLQAIGIALCDRTGRQHGLRRILMTLLSAAHERLLIPHKTA